MVSESLPPRGALHLFPRWLWPGLECKEAGPFTVPLTAFLFAGAPATEVEVPGGRAEGPEWKLAEKQIETACTEVDPTYSVTTHASLSG